MCKTNAILDSTQGAMAIDDTAKDLRAISANQQRPGNGVRFD